MRILRPFALLVLLASPASAAETDLTRFPFQTEAGEYRGLVVYADSARRARLIFLSLDVERPSDDEAVLRPGGDGRVVVQVLPEGETAFRTGAVLEFEGEAVTLSRRDGRAALNGSLASIALPMPDDTRRFRGRIAFDGLSVTASWPMRASDAFQNADIALAADAVSVDAALLSAPGNMPLAIGSVELAGTLALLLREDAVAATRPPVLRRFDLERARIDGLDGRIEAVGVADFGRTLPPRLAGLRGRMVLDGFPDILSGLVKAKLVQPGILMTMAAMARGFGTVQPDGSMVFDVETTADGVLVNGNPTGLLLEQ